MNTAEFELAYAKKLSQIEEKKRKLAEEHAEKKKVEEEKLHTFKPNLARYDRSRSKSKSDVEDHSPARSPNEDKARRMGTTAKRNGKVQARSKQAKVEERLLKHGHDKKRKIQESQ